MRFKGPKWYRARDYRRQAEMDGVADGVMKREQGKSAIGKETRKGGGRGREAENMRLKCNVLERRRRRGREREKPGHVMQLGGTAHWQNVERIKKRRRLQTLFLYRLACDLLVFTHLTAGEEPLLI